MGLFGILCFDVDFFFRFGCLSNGGFHAFMPENNQIWTCLAENLSNANNCYQAISCAKLCKSETVVNNALIKNLNVSKYLSILRLDLASICECQNILV
jgi:hypothetical protein